MKNTYLILLLSIFTTFAAQAQLQPGAWATPFTLTDINGNEHRLYDYLSEGKPVVMVISAAWCAPCWSLHTSGVLEEVYNTYGPEGSDEIMVIFIEGDPGTSYEQLTGQEGPSQGNWVNGTVYPMIDVETFQLPAAYGLQAFPTVVMICPDMQVKIPQMWSGLGNWTVNYVVNQAFSCESESLLEQDAAIHTYDIGNSSCYDGTVAANLYNTGSTPLTSATLELRRDGEVLDTYEWTGSLPTGAETPILFEEVDLQPGLNAFSIALADADDDPSNNEVAIPFLKAPEVSVNLDLYIQSDSDSEDHNTRWEIVDENGNIVAEGALANSTYEERSLSLEVEGCYEIHVYDEEGDGINEGGFILMLDEFGTPIADLSNFQQTEVSRKFLALVNISNTSSVHAVKDWTIFPNPVQDLVQVAYTLEEGGDIQLSCLDAAGRVLRTQQFTAVPTGTHQTEFNLKGLPGGWYQVQITTPQGSASKSIIKQ
ncbi:MAG: T9SS type A sorting domain-containing protein [Phaeodactylibacter sp.]|uniref:T9SS type A sorting domain-containing protein n=1 Tax=Phaeodactylibacter sp. TaxID=1940289 RepID=UPI0032ED0365